MTPSEFFTWQLVVAGGCMFAILVGAFLALAVCMVREHWRQGDEPVDDPLASHRTGTCRRSPKPDEPQRYDPMRWQTRRPVSLRKQSELGAYL